MKVALIDVPFIYGCDRKGCDLGFLKLEQAGLFSIIDKYNHLAKLERIEITNINPKDKFRENSNLKYLDSVVKVNNEVSKVVYNNLEEGFFPVIIGGDHSIAIASVAAASKASSNLGVIWIDAHADMNTADTTLSYNIHGMPLAVSLNRGNAQLCNTLFKGQKVKPENVYHIGARDIEPKEQELANHIGVEFYHMKLLRETGIQNILEKIIREIKSKDYDGVHISFDIDVMDSILVPGTGCPVVDGFTMAEIKKILSSLFRTKLITSFDFVEYNPLLDNSNEITLKNSLEILDIVFSVLAV